MSPATAPRLLSATASLPDTFEVRALLPGMIGPGCLIAVPVGNMMVPGGIPGRPTGTVVRDGSTPIAFAGIPVVPADAMAVPGGITDAPSGLGRTEGAIMEPTDAHVAHSSVTMVPALPWNSQGARRGVGRARTPWEAL